MHKLIFLFLMVFNLSSSGWAQKPNTYTSNKDADPKAKALLKQVKDKLAIEKGVEFSFDFIFSAAESKPTVEKGKLSIKNKKFSLSLGDQSIVSDQTTLWTYSKKRNEVRLSNAKDIESDELSPFKLLQIHDSPDFTYVLAGNTKINNIVYDVIEFKPLDKNAEFFKIRTEIDRIKKQYKKITLFLKSGDQYELIIHTQVSKNITDTGFVFDISKYPGAKTEDLR